MLVRMPLVSLSGARVLFVARAADVHEQRKPWVPLILEPSYRPNGWLGIMLGSRLYYEFTATVLSDATLWERLNDSVAAEVRRHGAPPPSSGPMAHAVAKAAPQEAAGKAAAAQAVQKGPVAHLGATLAPAHGVAAAGVSVSSVVHNNTITNDSSTNINTGNTTSIVLL